MNPVYGVLGYPVAHSLSPAMHNAWLRAAGLPGTYQAFEVDPTLNDRGRRVVEAMRTLGLAGVNLTVPLKTDVLPFLDAVDPMARAIGAVNTVVPRDGGLWGTNTDAEGFCREVEGLGGRFDRPAVVLGAGGAGRAVVAGLLARGCPGVRLLNRTRSRAEAVAAAFEAGRVDVFSLEALPDVVQDVGIVACCVAGPGAEVIRALPIVGVPGDAVWVDLNYWMQDPPHAESFRRRGRFGDGRAMLVHQGALAFAAFTGVTPDLSVGRAAVLR